MSKFSPGPWRVGERAAAVYDADGHAVCYAPTWKKASSWEPMARLIAAAPELLQGLEFALSLVGDDLNHSEACELHRLRALIARIEGGEK